jgi:hypothetical protein
VARLRCVVVGLDGFDPDVLVNLQAFYSACGFEVSVSREVLDADLIVVQRGAFNPGLVFQARAAVCHLYDYVYNGVSDLHVAFPRVAQVVVITPSGQASGTLSPPCVVRGFHPVVPALWALRDTGNKRPYRWVHIGHRKDYPSDPWQREIQDLALHGPCHFWGRGWQALPGASSSAATHLHGPASLHETQGIYRRAQRALGAMHAFQRGHTISGRMWQAPLNGCEMLTEAMLPNVHLPGVRVIGSLSEALDDRTSQPKPSKLVEAATAFWDAATRDLAKSLELRYRPPSRMACAAIYGRYVYMRHVKLAMDRLQA